MSEILPIRSCQVLECGAQFIPSRPKSLQKYCSPGCADQARKLQNIEAKTRYLRTSKGKRAKKNENTNYRKSVNWNEYINDYREQNKEM